MRKIKEMAKKFESSKSLDGAMSYLKGNIGKINNMKKTVSEYGGKEKYASKGAMKMHEKKEGKKVEAKEKMMMFGRKKK